MRIALLCPYSWTYPGGVTRHIEALASELLDSGHDVSVLAPFDPDDALSRRLHSGARPQPRPMPDYLVSLGRTIGLPANGAVSNLSVFPEAVATLRRELRSGRYDVAHIHEPVAPIICWDALCCADGLPLVGTFHTYSDNALTNGIARAWGASRRMQRLHVRIAVSEAAAWTGRRFFGGRYRVIPNGVHLPQSRQAAISGSQAGIPGSLAAISGSLAGIPGSLAAISGSHAAMPSSPAGLLGASDQTPLKILFIGQAVERKGLPVLLKAFEALREHVPATLTLVGASREEVAPLLLDDRGVSALGKVSEQEKAAALAEADLLCAPSLSGESFGMVLTEAFASTTPVLASNITGYRDVVRDGVDGVLVPPRDPVALAEALRELALEPRRRAQMAAAARERAERFAWRRVAAEVSDAYTDAIAIAAHQRVGVMQGRQPLQEIAMRLGVASADGKPRIAPQRLASLEPPVQRSLAQRALSLAGRGGLLLLAAAGVFLALLALQRIGVAKVLASLVASKPGLIAAGFGLMCASMFMRGGAWHSILSVAPTWRRARRLDALQGTFIGVLMSATLPVRLGETSRALIVARRIGRARETLPIVLGSMVSQTLLNLLALGVLGACGLLSVDLHSGNGILIALALAPVAALTVVLVAPLLLMPGSSLEKGARLQRLRAGMSLVLARLRSGLRLFAHPRQAATAASLQLGAWALQWLACWLLSIALGLSPQVGAGAAAAVLFAVNLTAVLPATPANIGVFQAACVAVLAGAYHVSGPDALAYGIVLQAVELIAAAAMGLPALMVEGLSWREVRLRTLHAMPVRLRPLSDRGGAATDSGFGS